MTQPVPLALPVGGVFCCSLLALYLLWLATLYRLTKPSVRNGHVSFCFLLVGLGGFVLIGARAAGAAGRVLFPPPAVVWADGWAGFDRAYRATPVGLALFAGGLLVAVAVAAWNRRNTLEVYHIDPAAVQPAVANAAVALGLDGTAAVRTAVRQRTGHATVSVRHLDPTATDELLGRLRTQFAAAPPSSGSAGTWYTAAAGGLLGCTAALFFVYFKHARFI